MAQPRISRRCFVACAIVCAVAGCASPDKSASGDCTAGAPCMTDNPGACAAGHIVCTGAKPACVSNVTEQPCYTGEPATRHIGACHDGTQSCVGALGTCTNQVLPKQQEDCFNNVDDDCDRDLNNGCPTAFMLGEPDPLLARGGAGGNPVSTLCPTGAVVTGVQIQLSAVNVSPGYVISVQPSCAVPQLVRGAKDYSVAMMSVAGPMMMGGTDAARPGIAHVACAADGLAAAAGTRGSVVSGDRTVIESLGIDCSTAALAFDASKNHLSLTFTHDEADSGSASVQVNGTRWDDGCAAGEVLIGFQGRTGAQMDQLQGMCAPLIVTYQ
jgi:hypothetical protein